MSSQNLLLGRRSLVVGWLFVSLLLFIAGQWQLHQLHREMRRQDNTLLRLQSVWHITEKHGPLGNSRGGSAPLQHTAVSSKQQGQTVDSSSIELKSHHTAASDASGSSRESNPSGAGGLQDQNKAAKQRAGPSSGQHTVKAHPQPKLDDDSNESSSSSSSASRKGGTFLQHLSDGAGQGKAATQQQQPQLPTSKRSSSAATTAAAAAATSAAAAAASSNEATKSSSGSTSSTSSSSTFVPKTDVSKSLLAPVLTATARAQEDPAYRKRLEEAASKPINIAVMTGLFWNLPTSHTQGCKVDGIPLDCHIQNGGTEVSRQMLSSTDMAGPHAQYCCSCCSCVRGSWHHWALCFVLRCMQGDQVAAQHGASQALSTGSNAHRPACKQHLLWQHASRAA